MLRTSLRLPASAPALGLLCTVLGACGGGGGGGTNTPPKRNVAPTITVTQPSAPLDLVKGTLFDVELVANDPDSVATVRVFADEDGDLGTTDDQVLLVEVDETNGSTQSFSFDSADLNEGTYQIVGVARDERNRATSTAPGTVAVTNVAYAVRAGGLVEDSSFGLSAFDDFTSVMGGTFRGSAIFGQGEPNETSLVSGGEDDVYIAKYDPAGLLLWAKRAGGPGFDKGTCSSGLVVAGFFQDTATFGVGEPGLTDLVSAGGSDVFVACYNDDGTLRWARRAGGTGFEQALGVVTRADGSLFVTGEFEDVAIFGQGEPNETTLTSAGALDIFLAHYDANGQLIWAKSVSGLGDQSGRDVSVRDDGSFLLACAYVGDATFGPGEPNETVLSSSGDGEIGFAHYNADGTLDWAKTAGGPGADIGLGIAAFADDSFVLTGTFSATAVFGAGEANETSLTAAGSTAADLFYGRFNADGTVIWVSSVGDVLGDVARDVAAFADNSFALTGTFRGTITFGAGTPNEIMFTADGANDSFVARITGDNALVWAARAGGSGKDGAFGVAAYEDESVGVVGRYAQPVVFGRGDERETRLEVAGERDIFLARYNPNGGF